MLHLRHRLHLRLLCRLAYRLPHQRLAAQVCRRLHPPLAASSIVPSSAPSVVPSAAPVSCTQRCSQSGFQRYATCCKHRHAVSYAASRMPFAMPSAAPSAAPSTASFCARRSTAGVLMCAARADPISPWCQGFGTKLYWQPVGGGASDLSGAPFLPWVTALARPAAAASASAPRVRPWS